MQTHAYSASASNHLPGAFLPAVLLRLFIISLLFCIMIISGFVLHECIDSTLSNYRRQMNAAAFNAQQLVNQRESLLQAITYSAIREIDATRNRLSPASPDTDSQLRMFALADDEGNYRWALMLTERDLLEIDASRSPLIYLCPNHGIIRTLYQPGTHGTPLAASTTSAESLDYLGHKAAQQLNGAGTRWFWTPGGTSNQVYLLQPLDPDNAEQGWLGLELNGVDQAFTPLALHQGKYALYDSRGAVVLHSAGWTMPETLLHLQPGEDAFGLHWLGGLPDYIVLNKSVGSSGWRLVFYTPTTQLLSDTSIPMYATLFASLLLCMAVLLGARYIRRRLVAPAQRHYSALTDSVLLNQRFIEVAPAGLCLIRCDDGSLILANESGRSWLNKVAQLREKILLSLESHVYSIEQQLPDGTFIKVTCAPTAYNGVAALLCCMNDVTEFKLAEQSLLQAKHLADKSSHEKTLFLSTLSHEIRTPMYGILGSLELLRTTLLSAVQNDYLQATLQASSALMQTINDTLEICLIDSGRLSLSAAPFSPLLLVEEVAGSYCASARSKGLRLFMTVDPDTPERVMGDGGRIRQILNNLMSNAIKFTASGHVILRLHCQHATDGSTTLRFQVVDSGPGIAPEFQARLFEPYYRAPAWRSQKAGGTGLGLAICQQLAQMMNGKLSATSAPGLGSSFSFSLVSAPCALPTEPQTARLGVTPVYVRGDVHEVVLNLCNWLRHWGALAIPYTPAINDPPPHGSVLVEAFIGELRLIAWNGPRVVMHAPGLGPLPHQLHECWPARIFSLASLREAVSQAQDGTVTRLHLTAPTHSMPSMELKLLAVDDSPLALQVISQQSKYLGNYMVVSSDATQALNRSDLLSFDAILTDLQMEQMDGLSFTQCLRERGFGGPIIGITGELSPVLRSRCEAAGIRHLLIKPVPLDTLCEVLQSVKRKDM